MPLAADQRFGQDTEQVQFQIRISCQNVGLGNANGFLLFMGSAERCCKNDDPPVHVTDFEALP